MKRGILEGFEVWILKEANGKSLVKWRSGYKAWVTTAAIKELAPCLN